MNYSCSLQVYEDRVGKFRFRIVDKSNGNILAKSTTGFNTRGQIDRLIVKINAPHNVQRWQSEVTGDYWWKIVSDTSCVIETLIMSSEGYTNTEHCARMSRKVLQNTKELKVNAAS